jgi:phosphatidylglycerol:prolipoprotein diacylglycerol transferase
LISSIVGARLHFVLGHPDSYANPADLFRVWEGGLTLYGGLVAAIVVSFLYLRRHRIGFLPVADVVAPSLALGEGITRIGCFLNGCCFGRPAEGLLCVHYPHDSYAARALGDVAVYPAQLYLAGAMAILFVLLVSFDRRRMKAGVLFGAYLVGQGLLRYAIDFTRYYEPVDRLTGLGPWIETKSQLVAIALSLLGLAFILVRTRRARVEQNGGTRA